MPTPTIVQALVWEDGGGLFMGRFQGTNGANHTQAGLSAITCSVFDLANPLVAIATPSVVIATSVFDTLQTDARWTLDAIGYNFRHQMPMGTFTGANADYRVEYKFTETGGLWYPGVFVARTVPLYMV